MIGRRKLITLLGGAAAWPLTAQQQTASTVRLHHAARRRGDVAVPTTAKKMKLLTILAVLLAGAAPASAQEAYWRQTWECGKLVTVELRKYGTAAYELTFSGALIVTSPTGKPTTGINLKWVGRDGAILNGKRCKKVPEGQGQQP